MLERDFGAKGVRLNVAVGPESGPAIVLLHGVTRRWQDFLPVIPSLAARWQVHAVDLRGHGRSGRTPGAYRVADYVPDVVEYLRNGVRGPAILVGHSLGGMVASAVAAALPDRVSALVLEDPTFAMTGSRIGETFFPELFRAYLPFAGSNGTAATIARFLAERPVRLPGEERPRRLGDVRDALSLLASAAGLKKLDPEALECPLAGRWLEEYDVEATLRKIACPVLFLQADHAAGGALPDDYAAGLASLVAECFRVKLPGVGHNIHATDAPGMLRAMLAFLSAIE